MATVGLKIQGSGLDGSFSLADTLAKAAFGDPEGIMKARLMASQVGAHDAYAANLAEKTREDAIAQRNRDAAGPAAGDALALAVPAPAPAIVANPPVAGPSGWDTIGATHSEAPSPDEVARVDKLRAANRALGPIIVNGNPEQVAKGFNTQYGGAVLSGAIGNPKIVSPDSLRLASTLYTGSAPTTSTVMTTGDFAGVDAKAREDLAVEAGKAALPDKPHDVTYRGQPGQTYRDPITGKLTYTGAAGTEQTPEKPDTQMIEGVLHERVNGKWVPVAGTAKPVIPDTFTGTDGKTYAKVVDPTTGKLVAQLVEGVGAAPVKPETLTPNSKLPPTADNPTWHDPPLDKPLIVDAPKFNADEAIRNGMTAALTTPTDPLRPSVTQQIALDYDQGYTEKFGYTTSIQKLPNIDPALGPLGEPVDTEVRIYKQNPNFISPAEMYKRANMKPPQPIADAPAGPAGSPPAGPSGPAGSPPVQTGSPPPAPAGGVQRGSPLGPVKETPINTEQEKSQVSATIGLGAHKALSQLTPHNIPDGMSIWAARMGSTPGPINSTIASTLGSPEAITYASNVAAFIEAYARPATGAQISPSDYQAFYNSMIPLPQDRQSDMDRKTQLREDLIRVYARGGWTNEAERQKFILDKLGPVGAGGGNKPQASQGSNAPVGDTGPAPSKAPQTMKDVWARMKDDAKARARARYGQ